MNRIKPHIIAPTVTGKIIGPAAPTPAESKLQADFAALEMYMRAVEQTLHSKIEAKERELSALIQRTEESVSQAHIRLAALEESIYTRIVKWFRKVFSWL